MTEEDEKKYRAEYRRRPENRARARELRAAKLKLPGEAEKLKQQNAEYRSRTKEKKKAYLLANPYASISCSVPSRSYEYNTWSRMKQRCHNKKDHKYPYYGGRGIKVCVRWRNDFTAFLADMGPRPAGRYKYSIDRIDNSGNYEPNNCRWATIKQQNNNQRKRRKRKKQ